MAERMIFLQNVYFDLGLQRLFVAIDVFYLSFKSTCMKFVFSIVRYFVVLGFFALFPPHEYREH